MTPNGACSMTARPWSPLKTSLRRNSTPGDRSPSVLSFSILCASRPILVSSISIVPSSTHCSMAMRRMWSMMRLRSAIVAPREPLERLAGGRHRLVDVGEQAEAALVAAGRWWPAAAPLPSRASTCSTTLRIRFRRLAWQSLLYCRFAGSSCGSRRLSADCLSWLLARSNTHVADRRGRVSMMPMITVSTGRFLVSGVSRALEPWRDQHEFAFAGPDRVDGHERAAGGHQARRGSCGSTR